MGFAIFGLNIFKLVFFFVKQAFVKKFSILLCKTFIYKNFFDFEFMPIFHKTITNLSAHKFDYDFGRNIQVFLFVRNILITRAINTSFPFVIMMYSVGIL